MSQLERMNKQTNEKMNKQTNKHANGYSRSKNVFMKQRKNKNC